MKYLSFFTGAMGLDLGLERAGWTCLGANEYDPVACRTIRANRPDLPVLETDIRSLSPVAIQASIGVAPGSIDAVVGGPPCQAFSTAGRRQGLNDDRGNVFLHFIELAVALEPQVIVIENVRGLLSAPLQHRPHSERGEGYPPLADDERPGGALATIVEMLHDAGYGVSFRLYDTSLFGVPQIRERVVLIATAGGRIAPHLVPLVSEPPIVREALIGLDGEQEHGRLRASQQKYLPLVPAGKNWRSLPPECQADALGGAFTSGGGRTGFLRRVSWDQPSPTLVTDPSMPATLLAHPEELRPLSIQEYKRLQTFPDDWKVEGTTAQKYRQLGNAVPVEFGRHVGAHISGWLKGSLLAGRTETTCRYRNTDESSWRPAVSF